MISLKNLLKTKNNDYTKLVKLFRKKTKLNIVYGKYNKKIPLNKSCSIIIPFYKNRLFLERNLISLLNQNLPLDFKKNKVEIIIINDGSPISLKKNIQQTQKNFTVIYLKLKKNYGRATARNLGLLYAHNEIIIFLDEDVVVSKNFISSHLICHEFFDKCIIVGFRHSVTLGNITSKLDKLNQKIIKPPNYKKDFRYKKFIPNDWKNIYKNLPLSSFNKICYPLRESSYFKNFGGGKLFGVWKLPFMFLTSNVSISKHEIIKVGGFNMRFKGWGLEDVHLSAKLIANDLYLIPNLYSTVYHLIKKDLKEEEEKIKDYKKNFKLYNQLMNDNLLLFKESEWKEKMKKYFVNKFRKN